MNPENDSPRPDRRQFHKTVLAGAAAAALGGVVGKATASQTTALPLNPQDALPAGATMRLGNTRFWHVSHGYGNPGLAALSFSPDGTRLAAYGKEDSQVSVWEVPSGRLICRWRADESHYHDDLKFSPCGRFLAVAGSETVSLWDPETGNLIRRLGEKYGFDEVAFSPDGKLVAITIDGELRILEVESGNVVHRWEADPHPLGQPWRRVDSFFTVSFSPDGKLLAAGSSYDVCLAEDDPRRSPPFSAQDWVNAHQSGPENQARIMEMAKQSLRGGAMTSIDGKSYEILPHGRVWCWDVESGQLVAKVDAHDLPVALVRFLANGQLFTMAKDGEAFVWDIESQTKIHQIENLSFRGYSATRIGVSDDRRHAFYLQEDSFNKIDLIENQSSLAFPVSRVTNPIGPVALSPDCQLAAIDFHGRIDLWNLKTNVPLVRHGRHLGEEEINVRFASAGRAITTTRCDVIVWDVKSGVPVGQLSHPGRLQCLPIPGEERAVCHFLNCYGGPPLSELDDTLVFWDWQQQTTKPICQVKNVKGIYPMGSDRLLLWTQEEQYFMVDLKTGNQQLLWHQPGPKAVLAISTDGELIAAISDEPNICVFTVEPNAWRHRIDISQFYRGPYPYGFPGTLEFSTNGQHIAMHTLPGPVCFGPVRGKALPQIFEVQKVHEDYTCDLCFKFLPNGRLLLARTNGIVEEEPEEMDVSGREIQLYDVFAKKQIWKSPLLDNYVSSLAFSPDGKTLASGGCAATALLWDISHLDVHHSASGKRKGT